MLKADFFSSTSTETASAGGAGNRFPAITLQADPCEPPAAPRWPMWKIYRIQRKSDGRSYIGVTRRSILARMAMHDLIARRRPGLGKTGSLGEAIREAIAQGAKFGAAFSVDVLARTGDPDQARELERMWIERLGTAAPHGFNLLPGGASLGGPCNAKPVAVTHPARGVLTFPSVMDAVAATNADREAAGMEALSLGSVYARIGLGWSVDQALELAPHRDRRRARPLFTWRGRTYRSLRELADEEGLRIDSARSKLYRARQAGCAPSADMAADRRRPGSHRTGGVGYGRLTPLQLPHPREAEGPWVDAETFARLSGVPKATVLNRFHRIVENGRDPATLTRAEFLAALTDTRNRRIIIRLTVPNGPTMEGGVREVIRRVLSDQHVSGQRREQIGMSAIRARLRRMPGWPNNLSPAAVAGAFGFQPDTGASS